jgi:hypothetical protein
MGFVVGVVSVFLSSLLLFKSFTPKSNEKYITKIVSLKKDLEFLKTENSTLKQEINSIQIDTVIINAEKTITKYKTIKEKTNEEKTAYISYTDSIKLTILKRNISN